MNISSVLWNIMILVIRRDNFFVIYLYEFENKN